MEEPLGAGGRGASWRRRPCRGALKVAGRRTHAVRGDEGGALGRDSCVYSAVMGMGRACSKERWILGPHGIARHLRWMLFRVLMSMEAAERSW